MGTMGPSVPTAINVDGCVIGLLPIAIDRGRRGEVLAMVTNGVRPLIGQKMVENTSKSQLGRWSHRW